MKNPHRLPLLLLLTTAVGCASGPSNIGPPTPISSGTIDLKVTSIKGQRLDLGATLKSGKLVALVFWQSWCAPCRREAPAMAHAAGKYGDSIEFVGVVSGPDSAVDMPKVRAFIDHFALPYPQVRDRDLTLTRRYEVNGTPTIVVLGSGGRVLYSGHKAPESWNALLPETASLHDPEPLLRRRETSVMGTELSITVLGRDPEHLEKAIDAAIEELRRVEDLMTDWRPSPLTKLNLSSGEGARKVPDELARLVARAQRIHQLTHGAFDITYAAVGDLWAFDSDSDQHKVPPDDEIESALAFVNAANITVDLDHDTVDLPEGMSIGLGGIAKGYGVDRAMRVLLDHGIEHAIVNAGGDMKVLGQYFGQSWEVVIKHPRDSHRILASLELSNTCCVTSGDYERFFEVDGQRYHHIIDPRTGRPATEAISATVIAPEAAFADSLATALCILPPQEGIELVKSLPRVEALIVDHQGEIRVTPGLAPWLKPEVATR